MSNVTQLILDVGGYNVQMPETRKGAYYPRKEEDSVLIKMISTRLVKEWRGTSWRISYQYGYFSEEDKNRVIAACEKGRRQPIVCGFLPQESTGELTYSKFFVESFQRPKFMWSRASEDKAVPLWGDFSVELVEVRSHA